MNWVAIFKHIRDNTSFKKADLVAVLVDFWDGLSTNKIIGVTFEHERLGEFIIINDCNRCYILSDKFIFMFDSSYESVILKLEELERLLTNLK